MNNILDYLDWRGDLDFKTSPFNEIDSIILAQLSYLNLTGIVNYSFNKTITFRQAAIDFANASDYETRIDIGPLINQATIELLQKAGESKRFANTKLCGFTSSLDLESEKQFSALTFILDDNSIYIAFRGTDQTLIGWKEDFNMAFITPVPSQKSAVEYLELAGNSVKGQIRLGGHSKGGNLAQYSSAFCSPKIQKRIIDVYNYDGPGFSEELLQDKAFTGVINKFHSFVPKSSIVGMLFDHEEGYNIVESNELGIMQHDPFSWFVQTTSFVCVEELAEDSIFIDKTVKSWLHQMDNKKRELFVDTLFGILKSSNSLTLTDLSNNWIKKTPAILKYLSSIEPETRQDVLETIKLLFKSAQKHIPEIISSFSMK